MNEKNSAGKELLLLLMGIGMCVGGIYLLFQQVTVESFTFSQGIGYWGVFGNDKTIPSGLIVIPLIIGIMLWIILPRTFIGKLFTGLGALIIILGIISSVHLRFRRASLFEFVMMLILIFGGAALSFRIMLAPSSTDGVNIKEEKKKDKKEQ